MKTLKGVEASSSKKANQMNINIRGIQDNSAITKGGLSTKSQTSKKTKSSVGYLAGRFLDYHTTTQETSSTNREIELSTNRLNVKTSSEIISGKNDSYKDEIYKQTFKPQQVNVDIKYDSIDTTIRNKNDKQLKENNSIPAQVSDNSFTLNKSIQITSKIKDNLLTSHNSFNIGKQIKSFRSLNSSPISKNPCNSLIQSIYSSQRLNTKLKDDMEFSEIQKSKTRFLDIKKEDFYSDSNSKYIY